MGQYYDVYCLLGLPAIQELIDSDAYHAHKESRFPKKDYEIPMQKNEAFLLSAPEKRKRFRERYIKTKPLYYREQPEFELLLERIGKYIHVL
ncbi:hypothetical protein GCM10023231_12370 [Olivibacter ginsenosidimutans]|uniref:Uncharacterized protein n=1 Tax=Olivibacter ginsenosidimutans TaxID=1176537 RepID=A0ABP9AUT9_9SPHI